MRLPSVLPAMARRMAALPCLAALAALSCAAQGGPSAPDAPATLEVSLWRGETLNAILPDGVTAGPESDGFSIRTGVLRDVPFKVRPDKPEMTNAADRVVWLSKSPRGDGLSTSIEGRRIVQIRAPRDAAPGEYRFGGLSVRLVDRELTPPALRPYYLDIWQHPWAVARWHNVEPFSKAHYAAMRPLWELLASLGQKSVTATVVDLPWCHQCYDGYGSMVGHLRHPDGSWSFDYSVFDEYVAFALDCGLGPDITCYSPCPLGDTIAWTDPDGSTRRMDAKPGTPEYEAYWGPFLEDFSRHLDEKGWTDRTLLALDERSPESVALVAGFIAKHAPKLRVAMAGSRRLDCFPGTRFAVFSQCMEWVNDSYFSEIAGRRGDGLVATYYVCNSPSRPNTFMASSPLEAWWLAAYPAAAGLDGFMRWAYNSWPIDPFSDASYGNWSSGDTFLVYPDGSPSIRLLMLQNGLETAEKLRLLRGAPDVDALARKFDIRRSYSMRHDELAALRDEADRVLNNRPAPPAMGWSSWNAYRMGVSASNVIAAAEALVSTGLAGAGYRYVNIDDGFFGGRDESGRLLAHPSKFPDGLAPVVSRIHGLGLHAGIYSDAGRDTCGCYWENDAFGSGAGLFGHDADDARLLFGELGFDSIKVDFCGGDRWQNRDGLSLDARERFSAIRDAMDSVKPGALLNVCRWNFPGAWIRDVASSWRISGDINPTWGRVKTIIRENLHLSAYARPGAYNDMDMLVLGFKLPEEEERTHFAAWCMLSSPLFISCRPESLAARPYTLPLLLNRDLIAIDQDTAAPQAYPVAWDGDLCILVRDLERPFGTVRAVAALNLGDAPRDVSIPLSGIDLGGPASIREVAAGDSAALESGEIRLSLPPHATRVFMVEAARRLERRSYGAETAFVESYQEIHDPVSAGTATIQKSESASCGLYASGLGGRDGNGIAWNGVWSEGGGKYLLVVDAIGQGAPIAVEVNGKPAGTVEPPPGGGATPPLEIALGMGANSIRLTNDAALLPGIDGIRVLRMD